MKLTKPYKFRPNVGQSYWYIDIDGKPNATVFTQTIFDYLNYEIGNTYQNRSDIGIQDMEYMPTRIMQDYRNRGE